MRTYQKLVLQTQDRFEQDRIFKIWTTDISFKRLFKIGRIEEKKLWRGPPTNKEKKLVLRSFHQKLKTGSTPPRIKLFQNPRFFFSRPLFRELFKKSKIIFEKNGSVKIFFVLLWFLSKSLMMWGGVGCHSSEVPFALLNQLIQVWFLNVLTLQRFSDLLLWTMNGGFYLLLVSGTLRKKALQNDCS